MTGTTKNKNEINGAITRVVFNPLSMPGALTKQFFMTEINGHQEIHQIPTLDFIDADGEGWTLDPATDSVFTGKTPSDAILHVSYLQHAETHYMQFSVQGVDANIPSDTVHYAIDEYILDLASANQPHQPLTNRLQEDGFLKGTASFYNNLANAVFTAFIERLVEQMYKLEHGDNVYVRENPDKDTRQPIIN